jgi:hypothetical protein
MDADVAHTVLLIHTTLMNYSKFSEEEKARNSFGPSYIYVHTSTVLSQRILQAQAAAAATATTSTSANANGSSEKEGRTESSAMVVHSNGTSGSSDSHGGGVWLPAAEFQGFSGTIRPVKVFERQLVPSFSTDLAHLLARDSC